MSGYGFRKKPPVQQAVTGDDVLLDFSGIERGPLAINPVREEARMRRGDALGFIDRTASGRTGAEIRVAENGSARRRCTCEPQINVYVKEPKDTLEWFEYTNRRGQPLRLAST